MHMGMHEKYSTSKVWQEVNTAQRSAVIVLRHIRLLYFLDRKGTVNTALINTIFHTSRTSVLTKAFLDELYIHS